MDLCLEFTSRETAEKKVTMWHLAKVPFTHVQLLEYTSTFVDSRTSRFSSFVTHTSTRYTPTRISPQTFSCHLISPRGLSTIACASKWPRREQMRDSQTLDWTHYSRILFILRDRVSQIHWNASPNELPKNLWTSRLRILALYIWIKTGKRHVAIRTITITNEPSIYVILNRVEENHGTISWSFINFNDIVRTDWRRSINSSCKVKRERQDQISGKSNCYWSSGFRTIWSFN